MNKSTPCGSAKYSRKAAISHWLLVVGPTITCKYRFAPPASAFFAAMPRSGEQNIARHQQYEARALPTDPRQPRHGIEMTITTQKRQGMLPAQRCNPDIVRRNRFAGLLQFGANGTV